MVDLGRRAWLAQQKHQRDGGERQDHHQLEVVHVADDRRLQRDPAGGTRHDADDIVLVARGVAGE